jgi:lipoate-protein ligase A
MKMNNGQALYEFTDEDLKQINTLTEEKYSTWEWNYGKSPDYNFINLKKYAGGTVEFNLKVENGIIQAVRIYGDYFGKNDVSDIEKALAGVKHDKDSIYETLSSFDISNYFLNISIDDLLEGLF